MYVLKYIGLGNSHLEEGISCQDYAASKERGDQTILALADGCGAYEISQNGAHGNVDAVTEWFAEEGRGELENLFRSPEQLKKNVLNAISTNLTRIAGNLGQKDNNGLSATLLFAVHNKKCAKLLLGHIGDGHIFCFSKNGVLLKESAPENGSRKNVTYFANQSDALSHFRLALLDASDVADVMLCSDGLDEFLLEKGEGDAAIGAQLMLAEMREKKVINDANFAEYLRDAYSGMISNIQDDWSVLVLRTDNKNPQKNSARPQPDVMTYAYLERYFKQQPLARKYSEELYEKARNDYLKKITE